jgi:hypothetical protein
MKSKLFLVLALILVVGSARAAEISKEKREEIARLLKVTGMEKLMDQIMGQMIETMRVQQPDVPNEFWEKFKKNAETSELMESVVELYDKFYTVEDLKAINEFYASSAGQKILSTLPQLMQESMRVGQEWGAKAGRKAMEQIEREYRSKGKKPIKS